MSHGFIVAVMIFLWEGWVGDEYRNRVRTLRARYLDRFAERIDQVVGQAPPFTATQLAWLRRVFQSHRPAERAR